MKIIAGIARLFAAVLLALALLVGAFLSAPAPASAHPGYVGYGCSGWTESGPWPWDTVQDCYAGDAGYPYVWIRHIHRGWGCPGDYNTRERLY